MNEIRALFYICALIGIMPYVHAMEDIAPFMSRDTINPEILEISQSGNYQIRYVNNELVLVDYDNQHRLYNLQAAIQPGSFSLPANISNQFIIAADNVRMDLSGHKVQGGIVVAPNKSDIKISNGLIGGRFANALTNGILVYSGCRNITIDSMQITNAMAGINFNNVTIGLINNCDFSQNTTGVLLQNSSQITVNESRAMQNVAAGFSLINSSTNCLRDCQSFSTGQGNTNIRNASVFGFVSSNGFGNIFERCIANSTQALSTTDFNSVVAGFALRGAEGCTKIIECEASNATVSTSGVTVPYGILLEATFSGLVSVTSINPGDGGSTDQINTVAWSSDGCYLAVGGAINNPNTNDLFIYAFNWVTQTLTQVDSANPAGLQASDTVNSLAWSPDGRYLAVNGTIDGLDAEDLFVYSFDRTTQKLTQVTSVNPDGGLALDVGAVAWSPDGQYLAFGGGIYGTGSVDLIVYKFDCVAQTLTQIIAINPDGGSSIDSIASMAWSPNGLYLAVGGAIAGVTGNDLLLYRFDTTIPTLIEVDSINVDGGSSDTVRSVAWSPNGKYLAVGGQIAGTTGNDLWVYQFNSTTQKLSAVVSVGIVSPSTDAVNSVAWSPDGTYLAVGGQMNSGLSDALYMYQFDPGARMLTQLSSVNPDGGGANDSVSSIAWSPDGQYIAVSGEIVGATSNDLFIYRALTFPSKNVINNNVAYCNSGGSTPNGIGISGSSIANMIIQNTAYSNPLSPFMVDTNYTFVQNVFNQQYGQGPTSLQNISVGYQIPINNPDNITLVLQQINAALSNQLLSSIDVITDEIGSIFSGAASCVATSIKQADIPTTLSMSGIYCLAEDVTSAGQLFTISANNVVLDLNNHKVTNASISNVINVAGSVNTVTIKNGTIEQTVSGGTSISAAGIINFNLENVVIKALDGLAVDLTSITNALISDCSFITCQRGMCLTTCSNIVCNNTQARDCSLKGFELVTSTTCEFQNCKAIGTGVGNTQTSNQIIAGFYSSRGSANIFENCIANGTQGFNVTDFDSVVAGFMLTSTENYTKIINCEASNSAVGQASYTVPYGILLQNQFTALNQIGSTVPTTNSATGVRNIRWSPNGQFLAIASQSNSSSVGCFRVLEFNRTRRNFDTIASFANPNAISEAVAWSPDGNYIAVDMGYLQIYKIDQQTRDVSLLYQININLGLLDSLRAIAWSPNGQYLAVGGSINGTNVDFYMFKFDPIQQTLTQQASLQIGTTTFKSVAWTPDGVYFALGGNVTSGSTTFYIYQWDPVNNLLTQKDSETVGSSIYDLKWSPDGRYLAVASDSIYIYTINKTTGVVTLAASVNPPGGDIEGIDWSADGRYLAMGNQSSLLIVYYFDRQANTFTEVANFNPEGNTLVVYAVAWDPAGDYLAVGRRRATTSYDMFLMYTAFDFPKQCVVKDNVVYCNSGGIQSQGVGISGSSTSNLIVGNTAYANPITPYMVNTNYNFVTNVFNPIFENIPALFENISLGYQQPIAIPENEAFLAQQLLGVVNELSGCGPVSLTTNSIISGTISITVSGNYCLASDLTTDISMTATCITLDLNNRVLTGVITIATTDNTTVQNGFIEPSARTSNSDPVGAVNVNNTAVRTTLANLVIRCANSSGDAINGRSGIFIQGADTLVRDCNITSGNASDASSSIAGGAGGHGIDLSSTFTVPRTIIKDCIIYTGNGGNAVSGNNNGGNAGNGINVANGLNTSINSVIVFSTGNGGTRSGTGVGGNGGNGIKIPSFAVDTQVFNCVLRNTGTGAATGVNGKAIDDDVIITANLSQIFSNIAYNISSATKFDLQAAGVERGILIPNPPGQSVFNILANVFT